MKAAKPVVLSLLAHPDDAEILCAGTLLRLVAAGWEAHVGTFTPGDCGSMELGPEAIADIRRAEGIAAARLAGARYHCLEERDLLLFYAPEPLRKTVALFRSVRPDIVLAHSPADYMPDHEVASLLVRAACFDAAVPNLFPDLGAPAIDHVPHLYYCDPIEGKDPLGRPVEPGILVDISAQLELKASMLAMHASQRDWLARQHGMDQYIDSMKAWARHRGADMGVAAAEGFRQHLGHGFPQDDRLSASVG